MYNSSGDVNISVGANNNENDRDHYKETIRVSNDVTLSLNTARQHGIEKCVEKMLNFAEQLRRLKVGKTLCMISKVLQTLQGLRMLSTVTICCQVTKIVMNAGSRLSYMSQVSRIVSCCNYARPLPHTIHNAGVRRSFWVRSCLLITLIKCIKGHKSLGSLL